MFQSLSGRTSLALPASEKKAYRKYYFGGEMNINRELTLIIIVISWKVFVFGQNYPESQCIVELTGENGICRAINDCPPIKDNIRNQIYTRCGFQGQIEIICCPTAPIINRNARISERKCDEYKSAVFQYTFPLSLAVGSTPNTVSIDKCGHTVIPLIVGGDVAKEREFPHMALIGYDVAHGESSWGCGGALISDEYVLTAGHCLHRKLSGEPKYVRLGELNLLSETEDARPEDFEISAIIPHPQYNRKSKYNDIALLRLNRKVNLNPYKRPACLPTTFEGPERNAIATGWGQTTWSGHSSSSLLRVVLEKFSDMECNQHYRINPKLTFGVAPDTQFCAGSKIAMRDTCQGDSGGPLQVYHPYQYCMYTIIGVTSFGMACGNIGVPGIYTRIFPYVDWIENIVWRGGA